MKNIDKAINDWYEAGQKDEKALYSQIKELMNKGATCIVPVVVDETVSTQYLSDSNGNVWCGVFSNIKEVPDAENKMLGSCPLKDMVDQAYRDQDCNGLVFNVWGKSVFMDKEALEFLLIFDPNMR